MGGGESLVRSLRRRPRAIESTREDEAATGCLRRRAGGPQSELAAMIEKGISGPLPAAGNRIRQRRRAADQGVSAACAGSAARAGRGNRGRNLWSAACGDGRGLSNPRVKTKQQPGCLPRLRAGSTARAAAATGEGRRISGPLPAATAADYRIRARRRSSNPGMSAAPARGFRRCAGGLLIAPAGRGRRAADQGVSAACARVPPPVLAAATEEGISGPRGPRRRAALSQESQVRGGEVRQVWKHRG